MTTSSDGDSTSIDVNRDTDALAAWVRREQVILWEDLKMAITEATDGVWSMYAGDVARRIVEAARLVGATPHAEVLWLLVAGGVYEAVLSAGGITPHIPDEQEWQHGDDLMAAKSGTRAALRARLARTVATINTDRERNWINGGREW